MKRWITLHPTDNIAIALHDLSAGAELTGGVLTRQPIARGLKVALRPIGEGEVILRYGERIGTAAQPIAAGALVHTNEIEASSLLEEPERHIASAVPAKPDTIEGKTFLGYIRPDGRVGTRNYIALVSTVNCSAFVVKEAARRSAELVAEYDNVDGVFPVTHARGCGLDTHSVSHERMNR
ncbi:MAG: UxaA family hydrolase, partial [Planctomycetota bacterium]